MTKLKRTPSTPSAPSPPNDLPPALEHHRHVTLPVAAKAKGISVDGFKRHYGHLIRYVTPRCPRVRVSDLVD
jgi:hypothetical protein